MRLGQVEDAVEDMQYLIDGNLRAGRVEVCIGGRFGSVCSEFWDDQDASVVCRELGLSPYGEYKYHPAITDYSSQHCYV